MTVCAYNLRIRHALSAAEAQLKSNSSGLSEQEAETNITGLVFIATCMVLAQFVHITFGWKNRHQFIDVMNKWSHIKRSLKIGPHSSRMNQGPPAETARYYLFVGFDVIHTFFMVSGGLNFLLRTTPPHSDRNLEVSFLSFIIFYLTFSEVLQDAVVNLTFYEISKSLKEVMKTIVSFTCC